MKVLIISFDKTLSEKLKELLLKNHEVFTVKNTEEALTLIPSEIDVIVFDAISGAVSEEEINQLYNQKFSKQNYIILYNNLFPVDENNIQPLNKVLVLRDKALEKVPALIEGEERKLVEVNLMETPAAQEFPVETQKLETSHAGSVSLSLDENVVKAAIIEAISKELGGLREEIKMEVIGYARGILESVVREEIEKIFLELRIGDLIKEETKRVVEEKLRELLS